jgi:hypothetical protein
MTVNQQFIEEQVTGADYITYDEDFNPVLDNNKRIEAEFIFQRGRRMNPDELEVLKTALQSRKATDEAFLDNIAVEKCHEHRELMMYERTLDDGLEAVATAVNTEVNHALATKGIDFEYALAAHPESDSIITQYAAAAIEVDQRNG